MFYTPFGTVYTFNWKYKPDIFEINSFQFYILRFRRFELKQFEVEIDFASWESTAASNVLRLTIESLLH